MGRTKELIQEDWERCFDIEYMYRMESSYEQEEEYRRREAAKIEVIDLRKTKKKKKNETKLNVLPF